MPDNGVEPYADWNRGRNCWNYPAPVPDPDDERAEIVSDIKLIDKQKYAVFIPAGEGNAPLFCDKYAQPLLQ